MEEDKAFMSEGLNRTASRQPTWNASSNGIGMQTYELNCATELVGSYFFNPNWDNSMDQSDPFESALSSMVSSPAEPSVSAMKVDANTRKRKPIPRGKANEIPSPAAGDAKVAGENDESNSKRSKQDVNETSKAAEPPKDYIHVRARRGQATDSHSLAERVRREKISERMNFLQDLVPGCNKVIGKAVMLDEIINYVQSLQRQVEFLSMKLSTVNPRTNINMEALLSKDMNQSRGPLPQAIYSMDTSGPIFPFGYQPRKGLPLNNGTTQTQFSMKTQGFQLPHVDGFTDANPQIGSIWEDDLQSIVQMGFGQNQAQSYQDLTASGKVKLEL